MEPLWDIFNNFWAQDSANLSDDENENDHPYPPVIPMAIEDGSVHDPDDDDIPDGYELEADGSESVPTTQPEQTPDDDYDPYADRVELDVGGEVEIEATQPSPMEPDSQPFTPPGPPSGFPISPDSPSPKFVAGGGEAAPDAPDPKVEIPGTGIGSMPPPPPLTGAQRKEKLERMEAIKRLDSNWGSYFVLR